MIERVGISSMEQSNVKVLRIGMSVRIFCVVIYFAGIGLLWFHLPFGIPERHRIWLLPMYAVLGLLWLGDIFTRRIILGEDSVRLVSYSDYLHRTIPRAMIKDVTWEKGYGASLILQEGRGIRLPNVGRSPQGLTNTIRAWLRRT